MIPHSFKAYLIDQKDDKTISRFVNMTTSQLDPGEVTVKVAYSSINYKDALAATGKGKIIRRFPCVGGIDLAGTVVDSQDSRFELGQQVLATSYDLGVAHHGGYAEYARVPADWLIPLPDGMTLLDSMALGTAGYTAALSIIRMEENGLRPENGKVLVTGATGGVGSLAINILAKLGYAVVALTGKQDATDYLRHIGTEQILLRQDTNFAKIRSLDTAHWAGALDNLGGEPLAWILSTMQQNGVIASVGLAAGTDLHTTVMPFILRGVSLLGIDSGYTAMPRRTQVWHRLATDMRPDKLKDITQLVEFEAIETRFHTLIQAQSQGRIVVEMNARMLAKRMVFLSKRLAPDHLAFNEALDDAAGDHLGEH